MTNTRWSERSDNNGSNAILSYVKGEIDWFSYGEGYKLAAEIIQNHIESKEYESLDFLIYPYFFLIRHYVELRLKQILNLLKSVDDKTSKKKNHNILDLMKETQRLL